MSNVIPEGQYRAVPVPMMIDGKKVSVQFGRSKEKQTPQVSVQFAILDEGPHQGRRLTWMGYFTENTVERTVDALRLCGFKGDELSELPGQTLDQEVSITIEHETYKDKVYAKVAWVNASGSMKMTNPMGIKDLRKFSAQYRSKVKARAAVDGPRATVPAAAAAPAAPGEPPEDKGDDPWASGNEQPPPPIDDPLPF